MNYNQNNFNRYDNSNYYGDSMSDGVAMRASKLAASAKTQGVLGLILSIFCCPIVALILGILAVSRAKTAKVMLGGDLPEGKTGRVCGIIAIVLSLAWIAFFIFAGYSLYLIALALLEEMNSMMALPFYFL